MRVLITLIPLAVFCALAVAADLRLGRIPNWLNAAGFVCGLAMSTATGGTKGLLCAFAGAALGLAILLFPFLLHMVGAGDVKFLAAAGAFTGWRLLWPSFLLGALLGGVISLAVLAFSGRSLQAFKQKLVLLLHGVWRAEPLGGPQAVLLPYAVPLSIGLLLVTGIKAFA